MRKIVLFAASFSLCMLVAGCDSAPSVQSIIGFTQGTTYHVDYWHGKPTDRIEISKAISEVLSDIDAEMSTYRPDSTLQRFNRRHTNEPQMVGADIIGLIRKAQQINKASRGCYDLTIKPLFELWGLSKEHLSIPTETAKREILRKVGMDKVAVLSDTHLKKLAPMLEVDFSSIAQGYSVAEIAKVLERHGVANYLVEIGGELVARGSKPDGRGWRIAIERPLPNERRIHKIIELVDKVAPLAVMTSGTYRHFFEDNDRRYSHILDARTGSPVTHQTLSVTVLDHDAAKADAWSTALLCLGKDMGLETANQQGIAALFIEQINNGFETLSSIPLKHLAEIRIE